MKRTRIDHYYAAIVADGRGGHPTFREAQQDYRGAISASFSWRVFSSSARF